MTAQVNEQSTPKEMGFWSPRRTARMAIFIALAAVGALIKFPSPTGTVALDSAPGFFSAIAFGWLEGGIVAGLGHLLTAATTGFPLGIMLHAVIAGEQFLWAAIFWLVKKKSNIWIAVVVATLCNGVLGALVLLPMGGVGLYMSMLPGLLVGSAVNIILAALAYSGVSKGGMLK